tara:strand:+ start:298 stop:612 length:315 start_codon:yes stop_codon:yes gene_type:complete
MRKRGQAGQVAEHPRLSGKHPRIEDLLQEFTRGAEKRKFLRRDVKRLDFPKRSIDFAEYVPVAIGLCVLLFGANFVTNTLPRTRSQRRMKTRKITSKRNKKKYK